MVQLKYISLVTKENIDYYLSVIKDERTKKDFMNTISKFDIRISTEPVIRGDEFFYEIWILKRGTKKRARIKEYYPLELLENKNEFAPSLAEILDVIRLDADVPDDFEEYCEMRFEDPQNENLRRQYLTDLKRAAPFKKFISMDDIRSIPALLDDISDEEKEVEVLDLNDQANLQLLHYSIIYLEDKEEYDKLTDLNSSLEYYGKIMKSYGFDLYSDDFNPKLFPITKDDTQMKNIIKNISNYNQVVKEYRNYLKQLIKKYSIKPTGNITKRLAFNLRKDDSANQNSNFITINVDHTYFS